MGQRDASKVELALEKIKSQASAEEVRITQHAAEEMAEEEIRLSEVFQAIQTGEVLEFYPEHRRGSCCLLSGLTERSRPLHIVCTTGQRLLVLITVYEPKPPKWLSPSQRGPRS